MTATDPTDTPAAQQPNTDDCGSAAWTETAPQNEPSQSISRRRVLASIASAVAGLGIFGTVHSVGATLPAQQAAAADWPQRGANAASTARLTDGIGPTGQVTKAWEDSLSLGLGRKDEGVAVVDETVYTVDGALRALNVADGTERWTFEPTVPELDYPEGAGADVRHPAVMNGTVYATVGFEVSDTNATQHTALIAVDAETGTKRWRVDSNGLTDGVFSPVTVANGRVYTSGPPLNTRHNATNGSTEPTGERGGLYAFDAADGTVRWRRPAEGGELPVANGRIYRPKQGHGVQALDAATGDIVWETLPRVAVAATPMVAEGTLFVTEEAAPGVTLIALDAATGDEYWRTAYPSAAEYPELTVGTVDDERVYIQVGTIDASVIALDRNNGSERWRATIPQPPAHDGEPVPSVPTRGFAQVGDLLYVGGAALNPATGGVVWTYGIAGPRISGYYRLRAVVGGRVYISGDSLVVLAGETDQTIGMSTQTPTPTPTTATPTETPSSSPDTQTASPTSMATRSPTQSSPQSPPQTVTQSSPQTPTSSPMPAPTTKTAPPPETLEQTTTTTGPGFGILATIAGAGLGVWRYLR